MHYFSEFWQASESLVAPIGSDSMRIWCWWTADRFIWCFLCVVWGACCFESLKQAERRRMVLGMTEASATTSGESLTTKQIGSTMLSSRLLPREELQNHSSWRDVHWSELQHPDSVAKHNLGLLSNRFCKYHASKLISVSLNFTVRFFWLCKKH